MYRSSINAFVLCRMNIKLSWTSKMYSLLNVCIFFFCRLWNTLIHDAYNQEINNSEFQSLKKTLINLKIKEYVKQEPYVNNCSECFFNQNTISKLCSVLNSILINALSWVYNFCQQTTQKKKKYITSIVTSIAWVPTKRPGGGHLPLPRFSYLIN